MEIKLNHLSYTEANLVVIPVFQENESFNQTSVTADLENLKKEELFKADKGEVSLSFVDLDGTLKKVLYLGLGKVNELKAEAVRIAFSKALKKIKELKGSKVAIEVSHLTEQSQVIIPAMVESLNLTNYKFDKYKGDKKESQLTISINGIDNDMDAQITEATTLAQLTMVARDLVNEPANVIYPETLANEAIELGKTHGFEVEVLDEKQIDELGMKAFAAVAMGSTNPPRLIVMRYLGNPEQPENILGLVGKGLTYDSGGYALKPAEGMVTMKCDMGGSAAVIGAIGAIAKQNLKVNVIAVVAACENMISGGAYKNGDIIGSMAGKTIEVINTDAEGRLTLVDAVHYIIEKEKVSKVVDVATLTGAALVALGNTTTAVLSNNDDFYSQLEQAAEITGEKFWRLPGFDEYKQLIKSDVADLKNSGGRFAGTITAGLFIGEFVGQTPWLHLDVAGTAWTSAESNYNAKGGTGAAVRTLYYLAKNYK